MVREDLWALRRVSAPWPTSLAACCSLQLPRGAQRGNIVCSEGPCHVMSCMLEWRYVRFWTRLVWLLLASTGGSGSQEKPDRAWWSLERMSAVQEDEEDAIEHLCLRVSHACMRIRSD